MKGKWTEFPHPNHPSLESLMTRCHQLHDEDPRRAPTILFIKDGVHQVDGTYLNINYPMKIVGAGQDKTIIQGGGFNILGMKEEGKRVTLSDMTTRGASEFGLYGNNGLSFLCDSVTFTQCRGYGVIAKNTKGRLINCVITQCKYSGIFCFKNALIQLEGDQTKVDGNVTSGNSWDYGLRTYGTSSTIHLLFPLTKESVSTNNHDGQNYGCYNGGSPDHSPGSTIQTVDSFETP
jgi:hypothetical protein